MKPIGEDIVTRAAKGAEPAGATDEISAATKVRQMFDSIAPRYDLLNHILSAGIDRWWWWRAARTFRGVLHNPNATVLDVCCGTGDMTMALLKHRPASARPILAIDFAHQMLVRGARKFSGRGAIAIEADAMNLPLADGSADLIVTAFGFRNLANYDGALREFHRVLKPGGLLGILDFNEPSGLIGAIYRFYFLRILPRAGSAISGSAAAYAYLPASVQRFPPPPELLARMTGAGFSHPSWTSYTLGIAGLYRGRKA